MAQRPTPQFLQAADAAASKPSSLRFKMNPTLRVLIAGREQPIVIPAYEFDREKHTLVEDEPAAPASDGQEVTSGGQADVVSEDTLRTMTLAALRELPEAQSIEPKSALRTKDSAIAAILAAREASSAEG